jgi:hypothetical protein
MVKGNDALEERDHDEIGICVCLRSLCHRHLPVLGQSSRGGGPVLLRREVPVRPGVQVRAELRLRRRAERSLK